MSGRGIALVARSSPHRCQAATPPSIRRQSGRSSPRPAIAEPVLDTARAVAPAPRSRRPLETPVQHEMPHCAISCRPACGPPAPRPRGRGRAGARHRHARRPEASRGLPALPLRQSRRPEGRTARAGRAGTFDSLNPFIIKGVTPGNMREYVFESLMARSGDEPFTLYGLIAESVELPEDRSSITFHLDPEARFSDGTPITPEDVLFCHGPAQGEGLALSPLALRQGGEGREDRRPQRALHLRGGRRPRAPADPRADADPAAPQDRRRDLRAHDAGAADRQRPLHRRRGRRRALHHLSPQPRLVGARPAVTRGPLQFR